jgi:hypothetical protein
VRASHATKPDTKHAQSRASSRRARWEEQDIGKRAPFHVVLRRPMADQALKRRWRCRGRCGVAVYRRSDLTKGRSWGLVSASYGVIGWFPVIVTRIFRCRRPCHAFVRHLANPISHSTRWKSFLPPLLYNRRIPRHRSPGRTFPLIRLFRNIHPSINTSINTFLHPPISFPSPTHQATTTTYLVYVPVTCHLPITSRAGSSFLFLPAKTPIGPQPHSSCDLHEALPSLARDLTRHTPFITAVQSLRRIHHYVFSTST